MPNTTWDPLDCHPAITLSGAGLIATSTSFSGDIGVRSGDPISSGKRYIEFTCGTYAGGDSGIGFAACGRGYADMGSNAANSVIVFSDGSIYLNGPHVITIGAPAGGVTRAAIDLDNNRAWFAKAGAAWNGSGTADPATNTGGLDISAMAGHLWCIYAMSNSAGNVVTLNTGDSAFTYAVPSGFTAGWPTASRTAGTPFSPGLGSSGLTFSNSNYTVAMPTGAGLVALSQPALTSGKVFFEYFINSMSSNGNNGVGAGANGAVPATVVSTNVGGAILFESGSIYVNSSTRTSTFQIQGAMLSGEISGVAMDLGAKLFWIRRTGLTGWNNGGTADPATGVGGFDMSSMAFPIGALAVLADAGRVISINSSTLAKTKVPAGFTVGIPLSVGGASRRNNAVSLI